ncbi:kinase-like domain-containing protein [Tricladium varicosporioides]|nr:kinase-like domain-containing protein [Hymenoscyphus varicosporioides]
MASPVNSFASSARGVSIRPAWNTLTLFTGSALPEETSSHSYSDYGFMDTIALAQRLGLSFLPITWQAALGQLGNGGQADIYQAIINVQTSFAFKSYETTSGRHRCNFQGLVNEMIMLTHPLIKNHPYIVKLEGVCWDIPGDQNISPVLVFEKAHMGDLDNFITSRIWVNISVAEKLSICADIGIAVRDMHSNGIVHGDLKPGNVLIFKDEAGNYVARVADFGYSTRFCNPNDVVMMPKSIPWNAPEHHHRGFSMLRAKKMDVYSFGAVCFWLLFERPGLTLSSPATDPTSERRESLKNLFMGHHSEGGLLNLALSLIAEEDSLSGDTSTRLTNFFKASLTKDPEDRADDVSKLVLLLVPERKIPPVELIQLDPIQRIETFEISSCLYQFHQADFRLRTFVVKELQSVLSDHAGAHQHISPENAALQLALCYQLGFGVARDVNIAKKYLDDYGVPESNFNDRYELIREANAPSYQEGLFKSLVIKDHISLLSQTEYYRKSNQLDTATEVFLREISDLTAALGVMHPLTVITISQLARILKETGRFEEAEVLNLQIIRLLGGNSGIQGEPLGLLVSSMINLASIYQIQGRWKESEDLKSEVLLWLKQGKNSDDPRILTVSANLAATYRSQGRLEEAESLEVEVLERRKAMFGIDHIDTLTSMSNLSTTLWKSGKWKEAEKQEREVIAGAKKVLGPEHPLTTTFMSNLATTYEDLGRYHDAIELMSVVMVNVQKTLGADHPDTLVSIAQVASLLGNIGLLQQAQRFLTHVVTTRQRVLGQDHPSVLTSMSNLASMHQMQGNLDEAEKLELQVIEKSIRILGEDHADTLTSQGNLAAIYRKQKRLQEAEKLERQVLTVTVQRFGDKNPNSLYSMSNLGSTLYNLGRYDEAEELFTHVMNSRRQLLGPENPSTLIATGNLSMTYQMQGRIKEAAELELQVLKIRTEVLGENHKDTLTSMNNLATNLKAQGRHSEAVSLMTECIRRQEQTLGADHALTKASQEILDSWHGQAKT